MNTHYTFVTKDGKFYSTRGANRFDAQAKIELACRVDLTGATWTMFYKLKAVESGIVK